MISGVERHIWCPSNFGLSDRGELLILGFSIFEKHRETDMNRLTRGSLFCGLTCLIVVIAIFISCSDDIILEPLPSLLGEYVGRYDFITRFEQSNQETDWYDVAVRFSDQSYWFFDMDTTGGNCFCQPSGEYIMGDNVELIMKVDGCAGQCVFDADKLPSGLFSLRRPADANTGLDSIVMTQITGDTCRRIRLVPAGN